MKNGMQKGIQNETVVRLSNGSAEIRSRGKLFNISRKDAGESESVCPVDLIAGALGS